MRFQHPFGRVGFEQLFEDRFLFISKHDEVDIARFYDLFDHITNGRPGIGSGLYLVDFGLDGGGLSRSHGFDFGGSYLGGSVFSAGHVDIDDLHSIVAAEQSDCSPDRLFANWVYRKGNQYLHTIDYTEPDKLFAESIRPIGDEFCSSF